MRVSNFSQGTILLITLLLFAGCASSGAQVLEPGSGEGEQGVYGQATIGPMCPAVREGETCPDKEYQAEIVIEDGNGQRVARFETDAAGRFRVALEPGNYRIVPQPGESIEHAGEQVVTVGAGQWVEVPISYDSGIR
jgi:hypothetical protein